MNSIEFLDLFLYYKLISGFILLKISEIWATGIDSREPGVQLVNFRTSL
jgi:hypothetical protein